MTRRRRRTRRHSIAVALGVCALGIPASAVAQAIDSDNRSPITRCPDGTSQPAAYCSSTLLRDGSPFVADVESEPAATADGFDFGDAAIGAAVVLLAVGGTRALRRPRSREVSKSRARRALPFILAAVAIMVVAEPSSATFPGENGRIAFQVLIERTDSQEIFTARPDGSDAQRLTSNPRHFSVFPDWSPDGQRIAFNRAVIVDGRFVAQIYLMNADGSAITKLTRGPGFHGFPAWSPDASTLAIRSAWGHGHALQGIWIIPASDPDGVTEDEAQRLTTIPAGVKFDAEPQFSPDGGSVVFTRFKDRRHSAIHRVNVDGTGLERLTPWRLNASDPDWSPDGQRIAFDSGDHGGQTGGGGNIYVMRADGGGRTKLTDRPQIQAGERFDVANNPVWSPSGTKIMYTHFLPERGVFVAMRADGSGKHVVLDRPRFPNKVDWGTYP